MKKTLALLTLSLLMVVAMMLGVSAAIADTDVGVYIRFDSAKAVEDHAGDNDGSVNISFDATEGAMKIDYVAPVSKSYIDNTPFIYLANPVLLKDYPYVRVTYKITEDSNVGLGAYTYANVGAGVDGGIIEYNAGSLVKGSIDRKIHNWSTLGKPDEYVIKSFRLDYPNNIYPGQYGTLYLYDIGLFKTEKAAYTYNPSQEYYMLDFTDPAEAEKWSKGNKGSAMVYNEAEDATVFNHVAVESGGDERLKRTIDPDKWFSLADLPYFSIKAKSTHPDSAHTFRNLDVFRMPNGGGDKTIIYGDGDRYFFSGKTANEYHIVTKDMSASAVENPAVTKASDSVALITHQWDPIDIDSADGTEAITFKYAAFYATEAEAQLEAQFAPKGLAGVMPTAINGKGMLEGVTDAMEYRVSGTGEYTAVPAGVTEIEVDAGETYDVRYAAKEGYNAGYAAQVTVPAYYKFTLNGVVGVEGELVSQDEGVYNIKVPFGTDLTAVELDYTVESNAANEAVLYMDADLEGKLPLTTINASAYIENPAEIFVIERYASYDTFKVTFEVAEPDVSDEEVVDTILASLATKTIDPSKFMRAVYDDDIVYVVEMENNLAELQTAFGATINVNVKTFEKATPGTAIDVDGTDGLISYSYTVTYGGATKEGAAIDVVNPAEHFRVLYRFNNREMIDAISFSGMASIKTDANGKIPLVDNKYAHMEIAADGSYNIYYSIGKELTKTEAESGEFDYLVDTADYPIMVFSYRSNKYTGNSIYFSTDYYVKNNTYQGPSDPTVNDPEKPKSGSFVGYTWFKTAGYWGANDTLFPTATDTFHQAVINGKGGTAGISYASSGYALVGGVANYQAPNINFPWTGKLTYLRANMGAGKLAAGDYMDLEYIGFFPSEDAFKAWDGSAAFPVTATDKNAVDNLSFTELNGAIASTQAAAEAAIKAVVDTVSIENGKTTLNVVSYKSYDANANTKGEIKFNVVVEKGKAKNDMDIYVSKEYTVAISVPALTLNSAAEAVAAVTYNAPAIYNKASAEAYIENVLLKDIKDVYVGYTFDAIAGTYTAPTADAAGSLTFDVLIAKDELDTNCADLTLTIAAGVKPVILNFSDNVISNYASYALTVKSGANDPGKEFAIVEDENALGGAYAKFTRIGASPEFNFTFYCGADGMPEIADLGNYPVVAYRYKAPGHTKYQIYYYTDLYTSGHAYQDFAPEKNVAEWNTHIYTMNPTGGSSGCNGSTAWDGALNRIRFDFFRNSNTLENAVLEIDYIGLFESVAQAEAFAAAPWLDAETSKDAIAEANAEAIAYANELAENALSIDSEYAASVDAVRSALTAELGEELGDVNLVITEFVPAVDGTAEDVDGTVGSLKFKVAFADSFNNGYTAYSNEFTVTIVPKLYITYETIAEYRAEGEVGLRFKTTFAKDWMTIAKEHASITYGTLVAPTSMIGDGLNFETENVANVAGVNIYADNPDELTYTAVITNIKEADKEVKLTARAYVTYGYMGIERTVLLDPVEYSLADVLPEA